MRVLVTGGAGFIGSHVVDRLLAAGMTPRIFDLRESAYHAPDEVETVVGDLLDRDALERALEGCDAVAHLAAAADVDDVARCPVEAEAVNSRGTLNVLEAVRRVGVGRVVYASTIWVYGNATGAVDEDDALGLPDHLYTATKLAGEMYCRSYGALYDLDCTILRFGIPYGPRARPAGVLPIFVRKALAGEALTIAGEGLQSRRFVYVEDLADGVVRGLAPAASGRVYNLVGDESVTVRGIADTVRDLVGDVDVVHTPARAADFAGAEVSGARADAELGWRPATSFAEGVARYLEWHVGEAQRDREREEEAATAPLLTMAMAAAPAMPAVRPSRRPHIAPRFVSRVLSWLTLLAIAGALSAYLATVHAIGLAMDADRTVAVLAVSALCGYLAMALEGPRKALWTFSGWAIAAAGLIVVYVPEFREVLHLAGPDESRVLLGLAGGALAIAIADAGLRLRRVGDERLAADRA
jgi:UDP-glucose 4-epimerase